MNLYELTEQYETLLEMALEDQSGAINYEEMILGMEGKISDKLDGCCKVLGTLKAQEEALSKEILRLNVRKNTIASNARRLRESVKSTMIRLDMVNHKSPMFTISVTKPRERIEITDLDAVPFEFKALPAPVVDKKAVFEALKAGQEIKGVRIIEGEKGLVIR